jgi:hypothetical protein
MHSLDQLPLIAVFIGALLLQVLAIEVGFRIGNARFSKQNKPQMAQVRAIMGASLGLLAFMLAFSFSIAQQHFEERTRAYMMEVSAIDSAYRGADLIQPQARKAAQNLLRDFAKLRIETSAVARRNDVATVVELIRESERIHDLLWSIAETSMESEGTRESSSIFASSVLAMIDAHDARLQSALFNRIPPVIWFTLFLMALLSMVITGYQAGLTGTRSSLATWTLALTFSVVMALVTDLDRPNMTLFKVNQQLMMELENRMEGGFGWNPEVHDP